MKYGIPVAAAAALLATALAGCGGGSSGGSGGSPATVKDTSIRLAVAPAGFGFANFKSVTRSGQQLLDGVGGFNVTDPRRTYVSLWYVDAAGARQQLAFMSLAGVQALSAAGGLTVTVPSAVTRVNYEIYDAAASRIGEVNA
jgi:hypothetical protein